MCAQESVFQRDTPPPHPPKYIRVERPFLKMSVRKKSSCKVQPSEVGGVDQVPGGRGRGSRIRYWTNSTVRLPNLIAGPAERGSAESLEVGLGQGVAPAQVV